MAGNVKTGNPWILDTAEEVVAKGTTIRIKLLKYVGEAANNTVILKDGDGKVIWVSLIGTVGDTLTDDDYFGETGFATNGLTVDTISAGTVYLYLASRARPE